jgi:hypothetical protein
LTSDQAVQALIDALESTGVDYMLVGSLSSNAYGIPRSTKDADAVVALGRDQLRAIVEQLGPAFRLEPQGAFETVTATIKHVIHVSESPFKIELFEPSDDPHDQERFRRRARVRLFGRPTYIPSPEDVIVTKLRWSRLGRRGRDVDDVRNVIAVQGQKLDWPYVEHWCALHGTTDVLDEVRQSIPTSPPDQP